MKYTLGSFAKFMTGNLNHRISDFFVGKGVNSSLLPAFPTSNLKVLRLNFLSQNFAELALLNLIVGIREHTRFTIKLLCLFVCLMPVYELAEAKNTPEKHKKQIEACKVIPVAVPEFKCDDGYEVAKFIDSNRQCKDPENLYARCVFQSTLGQLEPKNKDGVKIFYSCRKHPHGRDSKNDFKTDTSGKYYDIALIQHDPNSGNTCFYQRLGDYAGNKTIPAPKDDDAAFWNITPNFCAACHTNGPFIRTPHYQKVIDDKNVVVSSLPAGTDPNDYLKVKKGYIKLLSTKPSNSLEITKGKYIKALTILPSIYLRKRKPGEADYSLKDPTYRHNYQVLHPQSKVWEVSKKNNQCSGCHSIGGFQASPNINKKLTMSMMNDLAVGNIMSLRENLLSNACFSKLKNGKCPSPTSSGLHPFMDGMNGSSVADLQKSLQEIGECFQEQSKRPKDCVIRDPLPPKS